MIAQERFRDDPWKLLVSCVLRNRARGAVAYERVEEPLFERFPDPAAMAAARHGEGWRELVWILAPLGFQNRRAAALTALSHQWVRGVRDPRLLPGCGRYAQQSYRIFIGGDLDFEPEDRYLREYVARARQNLEHGGSGEDALRGVRSPDPVGSD